MAVILLMCIPLYFKWFFFGIYFKLSVADSYLAKGQFILYLISENRKSYDVQKLKGGLKSFCIFKLFDDLPLKIVIEEQGRPTNLASFKLDLRDTEKKAKEELILPYTLVQNASNSGGMIHYVPDEADDWDEEDLDDDLEV